MQTCSFVEHFLFVKLYPTLFGDSLGEGEEEDEGGGGEDEKDEAFVERLKELSFLKVRRVDVARMRHTWLSSPAQGGGYEKIVDRIVCGSLLSRTPSHTNP